MGDDMTERVGADDRPDLHNPSIDEEVASMGACGRVHLPTGRTCTLAHGHGSSCDFVAPDEVPECLLESHPAGRAQVSPATGQRIVSG